MLSSILMLCILYLQSKYVQNFAFERKLHFENIEAVIEVVKNIGKKIFNDVS